MRPVGTFLDDALAQRIIGEARHLLGSLGVEMPGGPARDALAEAGAAVDDESGRVHLTDDLIDEALRTAPSGIKLYDSAGRETHDLSGRNVYFTPGSAAITVLDHNGLEARTPTTADYVRYAKLVTSLDHIASQSTAFIPGDVPEMISDSYRLYLSLLHCAKPIVTGAFTIPGLDVMIDLLLAVRGTAEALRDEPLAVFSCCALSPLRWSDAASQHIVECARWSIPVEIISMPLAGFTAPVTLVGTLVAHTAEVLSGVVLSQVINPGAPVLFGGSAAIFDMRYQTTPMGAVESMMLACACNEIGKKLSLPTQAYMTLSDAKLLDAQAGAESAMGATLAVLAGINSVSGPGMFDFQTCFSLEKLILDNDLCGMALRLARGVEPRDDFPALPRFEELLDEGHLLMSEHTIKHVRDEHFFPSPVIDRVSRDRWAEQGSRTLGDRAHDEVQRRLDACKPIALPDDVRGLLVERMTSEARAHGMNELPAIDSIGEGTTT
ncbi:MAG: trimethylamine methyltransferase family protein [Phycisphaerales bacterium]|nr:trimethylamine methyltransferase family protein [Phycisphaerales bacterium]